MIHAIFRGVVGAMAMTGVRVFAKHAGLIREDPPSRLTRKKTHHAPRTKVELVHWGMGAAFGATYGMLPEEIRRRPWSGPAFGLVAWMGFDAVVAPALGLTTRDWPKGRERAVFMADHVLFGLVLSELRVPSTGMTAASPEPRSAAGVRRVRVRVEGVVQGVGFRPYVHRLATELGLAGFVHNDARGVVVEAEGDAGAIDALLARLPAEAPPMAVVDAVTPEVVPARNDAGFVIASSAPRRGRRARLARRGDLRGVPARALRPGRPPLPLPVHQLHGLRPALHDRPRRAVRPAADHDGRLHDVRPLRGRVPRPHQPPLPRPTQRLPDLRTAARPSARGGRRPRCGRGGSSRSRGSGGSISRAWPRTRTRWRRCGLASTARRSRSR